MAKIIVFLDRLIYLYLYFMVCTCVLSWIPNINPDYPLFHWMFVFSGTYILPPLCGFLLGPCILFVILAFCSLGLRKIYNKYYSEKERNILIVSPEDLIKKLELDNKKIEEEENNDSK